ncbi:MAG: hypothetical protein ACI92E_000105 [Oceanicoccus sp.]
MLREYSSYIQKNLPDAASLARSLSKDAISNGPIVKGLESRLADAQTDISEVSAMGEEQVNNVYQEMLAIQEAAKPEIYGMILSDPINVLADMSKGKLARVAALSKEASSRINEADDFGAGSQLVGNPQYGNWRENSSGNSFWHWYGQYAFFSTMLSRPIMYNRWSGGRDYSYYNDYGRSAYTSPAQRRSQQTVERNTSNKFKSNGQTFKSPYAKTKQTSAAVAKKQSKFSAKPRSRPAPKSTTSSYRNSSYQSSRSSFGGK